MLLNFSVRIYELQHVCYLDEVMVSVFDIRPKVRRFKPGQGDGFLKVIKICSTPSFKGEVNPSAPYLKSLQHVKITSKYEQRYL
jgi:hypothetical protein